MQKREYNPGKIITVIVIMSIVMVVSLAFGHVLGGFYLDSIGKTGSGQNFPIGYRLLTSPEGMSKKKVLRLDKVLYHTIQVGAFSDRDAALALGKVLAQKGLPAVITGDYRVLVGFLNNREKLHSLADRITIDGQKPVVVQAEINAVSFKFNEEDTQAAQEIAPFLGKLSVCLHKGLLLYSGTDINNGSLVELEPKFILLASELEELAAKGKFLAQEETVYSEGLLNLSQRCTKWAQSLRKPEEDWQALSMMISQQHALALVEDYHRFMSDTN